MNGSIYQRTHGGSFGHYDEDFKDEIIYMPRRNSSLDNEIFLTFIPKWKYDLNGYYDELAKSLFKWNEFFELCKYKLQSLLDFIHTDYFYKIINIHNQLIEKGCKDGVLPLLVDLMQRKLNFLIPYVFITSQVPNEYKKINFLYFGLTDKFPELITKTKTSIINSNPPVKLVKEIFKMNDIYHDFEFESD